MKKLLKIAAILAVVFVAFLGAAAIAIKVYLPPEKLKALAISGADSALHRKLEVRTVDVGLFTGLRIEGLRLSETPDFSKGEFLKADTFILKPEWLPLLHKEIVARQIVLRGVSANVTKDKAGRFNFSDLLEKPSAAAPASAAPAAKKPAAKKAVQPAETPSAPAVSHSAAAAAPIALAVNSLRIENARLHYVDQQQGAKADVKVNSVAVDGFSLSGPFTVALDVQAEYAAKGQDYPGHLRAKGTLDLGGGDPALLKADITAFTAAAVGKEITGSLKFENAEAPKAEVTLRVPPLDDIHITVDARLAPDAVTLNQLSVRMGDLQAKASGTVNALQSKAPTFNLKFDTNKFQLASMAADAEPMKQFALGGTVSLNAVASGTAAAPKASGTLSLNDVAAKYQGQTLSKVTGQLQFTQESVNMPQLTGNLNGGDFKLKIAASNPAAPTVTLSGWMSVLDLGTLQKLAAASGGAKPAKAAAAAPAPTSSVAENPQAAAPGKAAAAANTTPVLKTSGDITVDKTTHPNFNCGKMTLKWNLTGVTPDMKRLNGTAELLVGPGQTTNILDFADKQGGFVRAMALPLEAMQKARGLHIPGFTPPDMQNIPFNKIQGDYTIKNGVVSMQPSLFDSSLITLNTTGTADMVQQTQNLKTQTKSALGEIDLTITGSFSSPTIRPNLTQQTQATAKQLLQNQGKALLKQFFH